MGNGDPPATPDTGDGDRNFLSELVDVVVWYSGHETGLALVSGGQGTCDT